MPEQLTLLLRDSRRKISLEVILSQETFKDALKLCKSISGLDDKQICSALGMDAAQWSRIWSGSGHFPENKINDYMEVCQNVAPLIWLNYKNGYMPVPLKSELESELERVKIALSEKEKELETIKNWEKSKNGSR